MLDLTNEEKFELIYERLKETGKTLPKEEFEKLCSKIMNLSTEELANIGINYLKRINNG
jgi:hypothetical protein